MGEMGTVVRGCEGKFYLDFSIVVEYFAKLHEIRAYLHEIESYLMEIERKVVPLLKDKKKDRHGLSVTVFL